MDLSTTAPRSSTRLTRGNVVLANSQLVDTRPVKARFDTFTAVHQRYLEAHQKVAEAETLEDAELKRIQQLDGTHNKALAALSAALLLDGEPRRNPFGRFAPYGPGQMIALSFADKVASVQNLVATLRRSMGLSDATLAAADKTEQAAAGVEAALPGWNLRRTYTAMARQARDALALQWDTAYRALRHMSLSVVEAPGLHAVLFAQPKRSPRKVKATGNSDGVSEAKAEDDAERPADPKPIDGVVNDASGVTNAEVGMA